MHIRLLTITHKSPSWINEGFEEYAKRLPRTWSLELIKIAAEKRTINSDIKRSMEKESEKMLAIIKPRNFVIALDRQGEAFNTEQLAKNLALWRQNGRDIDFLIGGPEGLSPACLKRADKKWSLSPLTFPHNLVRIIVAEQIYRAFSILENHPYHR